MAYNVSYIYQIIDKYTPALKRINAATGKFQSGMKRTARTMDKVGSKLGSFQSMAAGAASAIGGKMALDKFVGFDAAMNKLESVTFGTTDQMQKMRDTAKQLGSTTQFTAGEAAQGMTYLAMAGLDTEQVLKAIPGALQLAAAGNIELGQAADIATNVLGQMGMEVEDLTKVNNVLAMAQSKANFNITELFEAMRPVGTTAKNLGISLEELTAYLGTMANAGEKGSIAGTLLRNAMTEVSTASEKQRSIYQGLGIDYSAYTDKIGKLKDFKGLIGELGKLQEAGKLSVGTLQDLYGERGFRAMQILAGAGAESIEKLQESITGTTAAQDAAVIQMKGLPGALKAMSSAFESVIIAIFESGLSELLIDVSNKIISIARAVGTANPTLLKIAGIFSLVTVALVPFMAFLGLIMPVLTMIPVALGAISVPMVAFAAAFVGVGAAIYQVWQNWDYLVMDLKYYLGIIGGLIETAFDFSPVGIAIDMIKMDFESLINKFKTGMNFVSKIGSFFGFGDKDVKSKKLGDLGVAAKNDTMKSTLNGSIKVSSGQGSTIDSARMKTNIPGNLGFNLAGAH